MKPHPIILILLVVAVSACTLVETSSVEPVAGSVQDPSESGPTRSSGADLIFFNGKILTMEEGQPVAQAIAIRGGRILEVGDDALVGRHRGANTQVIDLQGRTLMPGFIDSHTHIYEHTERTPAGLKQSQDWLLSQGITAVAEAGVREDMLDWLVQENAAGRIRVRTSLYLLFIDNCGNLLGDWYSGHPAAHLKDDFLRVPGLKMFMDGSSCNVPAVSFEYAGGGNGNLYFNSQQLIRYLLDAQEQGYQVATHALGDRAAGETLDAIETALAGGPNTYRHRIEHNTLLRDEQLARYGKVGVVTVIFGKFPTCFFNGDTSQFKYLSPEEKRAWEWRYAELIEASPGLLYAWHSDYPVFPSFNPVEHLYGLVTRKEIAPDGTVCNPAEWAEDDRIPVGDALQIMTIHSAYAIFFEDVTGSIEPGKFADLIILSGNPQETAPDALIDLSVRMTMVGGRVEFCAEPGENLCPAAAPAAAAPQRAVTVELSAGRNLALGAVASASNSLGDSPAAQAVDGSLETSWNAGGGSPQWIEIDLGRPERIAEIRLIVAQYPAGKTEHHLLVRKPGGEFEPLHTFRGLTQEDQWLVHRPELPLEGVQAIRVKTLSSPSWAAWAEIEILGL